MAGDNNTLYEQVLGAEQSVIGSMLIDPKTVGLVVAELSEEDFSLEATRNLSVRSGSCTWKTVSWTR